MVQGVRLTLAEPDTHDGHWIDHNSYVRQREVARDQVLEKPGG